MIVSFCNLVTTRGAAFIQWKINRTYIYKRTSYFYKDKLKEKTILQRRRGDNPGVQTKGETSAELHNEQLYAEYHTHAVYIKNLLKNSTVSKT